MCNKILMWFLLLFTGAFSLMSAQTNRFFYDLQSRKDSTQEYRTSTMVLDINPKSIKFYDKDLLDYDSINKNDISGSISRTNTKTDQLIIRIPNSFSNSWYRDFFDYFIINSNDEIKWNLHKDTQIYDGYNLQKATTDFGGRTWVAWFSKEINIPEGPYKFRGLPGLIFLLKDSREDFIYKLVKNKKLKTTFDTSDFLESHYGKKPITISNNNFNKYLINIYDNPVRSMSDNVKNGGKASLKDEEIKTMEELNQKKKVMQNMIKNRYLYIEKDKQPTFK